jgi:hypothetical protein
LSSAPRAKRCSMAEIIVWTCRIFLENISVGALCP